MAAAIDFYFDFSSPYGYFAATRIDELATKYERDVEWHPILLGPVFKTTGSMPLVQVPIKGDYAFHDFERTARFHGIPYKRPGAFPISTQAAARAVLWVRGKQGEDKAIKFARQIYKAYFVDGINIGEPMHLLEIGHHAGIDTVGLTDGINSLPIKNQLKAEVDLAMARGVFGSPFVIADGEAFWGFDRFDQLEAFLRDGKI
ncbi:2-hydroxychromene-2-carboxylate isomerase [Collimonas sp. NPDC087041]|uniref:2-hydroxychromene-2-carboxylate isomerase n=1 Tax=Collimonas sp. NPDC087041 TaxID=3363960 RepID=UPI003829F077